LLDLLPKGPEDPLADEYLEGELAADAGADATDADAVAESGSEASAEAAGPGTTTADDATSADVDADAAESADDLAGGEDLADDSGAGAGAAEDAPADTPEQSASGNTSGGSSAGNNCFKAGTLVATPLGEEPIEKIKVGDLVESRDPATVKTAFEPVLKLYVHYHKAIDDVTLISAGASAETIAATPQHPFHVTGIGWVAAGNLKTGEHVDDLAGPPLNIKTVVPEATTQTASVGRKSEAPSAIFTGVLPCPMGWLYDRAYSMPLYTIQAPRICETSNTATPPDAQQGHALPD